MAVRRRRTKPAEGTFVGTDGNVYQKEDQIDVAQIARTTLLMAVVVFLVAYFVLQAYWLIWDAFLEYYFYYEQMNRAKFALRAAMWGFKLFIACKALTFLNAKLLLRYNDEKELPKYDEN